MRSVSLWSYFSVSIGEEIGTMCTLNPSAKRCSCCLDNAKPISGDGASSMRAVSRPIVGKRRTIGSTSMNSGTILRKCVMGLCIVLLVGIEAYADSLHGKSHEWTLEQLVMSLKDEHERSVSFEEATYSSLLNEPLTVRGVLRFTPPATLEKEITDPYGERYVIEGDRVLVERARKGMKKSISLEDYPALRSFVEAFRASFTGNAAQLKKIYETTVGGNRQEWTLLLRPLEPEGKAVVDYILFSGSEGRVASIAIRMPDGDRSVMTLRRGASK